MRLAPTKAKVGKGCLVRNESAQALTEGAATGAGGGCRWWTRSPGGDYALASCVQPDGTIDPYADASDGTVCVRPAMWIAF